MDWGLCQPIDPEIQTTLIAHISHLVGRDYPEVPSDFVKLGFVPAGKEQVILEQGVVEVLADIYGRWAMGGGVRSVGINAVLAQVSGLTSKYGNLFQVRYCPEQFIHLCSCILL
jgi:predicted unusual protein kinase regulating ubiquinone biosynthesis (AarF/ABC1/UbiB family)